jgi:probable HAF family extracellular repeat protein
MKSRTWMWTTIVYLFAALAMPVGMAAQSNPSPDNQHKHHQYKLIDMGTFGGPNSYGSAAGAGSQIIDGEGVVTGFADTSIPDPYAPACSQSDCFVAHTFRWQHGTLTDLGALPGVNSSNASGINERGWVAGYSENGTFDPVLNLPAAHGVLWKNGKIIDLGTLGGYESNGIYVNNAGQVVGFATNTIPDPYSFLGAQTHTFLWQDGVMRDLGTLGGPDSFPGAGGINQQEGLIAGGSFTNWTPNPVTGVPTFHPFLWKDGNMQDLGTLGGTLCCQNLVAVNNLAQVAGDSNLPGDLTYHPFLWDKGTLRDLGTFGGDNGVVNWVDDEGDIVGKADLPGSQTHDAFWWRNGKMTDLGTVEGDPCSNAEMINSSGQIVGTSSTCYVAVHAFLWENGGPMVDLNTLVTPGSGVQLNGSDIYINNQGEIVSTGTLPNGDSHLFLLIPCDEKHPGECQDYSMIEVAAPQTSGPAAMKQGSESLLSPVERFRSQMRQRYHLPGQPAAPRD